MAVKTITIDMAAYEALSRRITTADALITIHASTRDGRRGAGRPRNWRQEAR